jgi:hypothetical protein
MWAALDDEGKKPYTDRVQANREENDRLFKEWAVKAADWDKRTWEVKDVWIKEGNSFEEFKKRRREEEEAIDDRNALGEKRVRVE